MKYLLASFLFLLSIKTFAVQEIKLCAQHMPPYVVFKKGEAPTGLIVRKLDKLYNSLPLYKYTLIEMPYKRCAFEITLHNKIDGMAWTQKKPKHLMILDFPKTKFDIEFMLWFKQGSRLDRQNISKKEDLFNYRLGMIRGISANSYIDYAITNGFFKISETNSYLSKLRMLSKGRVDFIYSDSKRVDWHMKKLIRKFTPKTSNILSEKVPFYLSPLSKGKNKKLLEKINEVNLDLD